MKFLAAVDQAQTGTLAALGEDFFKRAWDLFPEQGSEAGLAEYHSRLSRNTPEDHARYVRLLRSTLEAVEALPVTAFRGDAWIDRRGFLAWLRTARFFHETQPRWRIDPQSHANAAVQSIHHLVVRHPGRLPEVLEPVLKRLQRLPQFLAAGADCLERPVPLWSRLGIRAAEGAAEFIEALATELAALPGAPSRTGQIAASAAGAFRDYARAVARKRPGPEAGFATGPAAFEFLLRERSGLDWSVGEAWQAGRHQVARSEYLLAREAARMGRRPAAEILQEAREQWRPAEASLTAAYRAATAALRERLTARRLVSLPEKESLLVQQVPAFLRHQFPTAAYSAPGPFDPDQTGIFWVNDPAGDANTPAGLRRERAQHFGLELTCAHEAYPGHHLQFIVQNRHPSRLRRMFSHAIFYEGWTLWCEQFCTDQGLIEGPQARLLQLHDAVWRAHRILIDVGLQTGEMTPAQAVRHLVRHVGFTKRRAEADVNWYTAAPTVPMSYLLGRTQLEEMFGHFHRHHGWDLRRFNDWALSHGAVPWSWIWKAHLTR